MRVCIIERGVGYEMCSLGSYLRQNKQRQAQIMNRHSWSSEEDDAILQLVHKYGVEDWTRIAGELRSTSIRRTGKQCRERWYNHLSPQVNKLPWREQEELTLFDLHRQYGNRWKDISRLFTGRTDNDIKNHFYSTLRRSLRRLNKLLGEKNSTSNMREIKPTVLSKIMNCMYLHQIDKPSLQGPIRDFPRLVFQFANLKPVKNSQFQKEKKKIIEIFELISKFNQEYEESKKKSSKEEKKSAPIAQNLHKETFENQKEPKTSTCLQETRESNENLEDGLQEEKQYYENDESIQIERKLTISLENDEMLSIDFQDPEQPSCQLMVVGRRLELHRWEFASDQISEEIL